MIGLTGVGGGVLMTPILILFFGIQPSIAVGTDLFYAALTKVAGAMRHWRQGNVDFRLVALLSAGSLPAALVGITTAKFVKDRLGPRVEPIITAFLAWVCIVVAVIMLLRVIADRTAMTGQESAPMQSRKRFQCWILFLGTVTGASVALTSIGAGSVVMIFLMMMCRMPASRLVGTDLFHAAILASVASLGHLWAGNVDFSLAAYLLLGSLPGVILGSRLTLRLPELVLKVSVALILAVSGTGLIVR